MNEQEKIIIKKVPWLWRSIEEKNFHSGIVIALREAAMEFFLNNDNSPEATACREALKWINSGKTRDDKAYPLLLQSILDNKKEKGILEFLLEDTLFFLPEKQHKKWEEIISNVVSSHDWKEENKNRFLDTAFLKIVSILEKQSLEDKNNLLLKIIKEGDKRFKELATKKYQIDRLLEEKNDND